MSTAISAAGPAAAPVAAPGRPRRPFAGTPEVSELLRTLGALCLLPPTESAHLAEAAGLEAWTGADHTAVFVLDLPPYASVHLGPEGKLGGEAADRAAGIWRVLGLTPPSEPDHLGVLLALYAELREAATTCRSATTAGRLERVAVTVLDEQLWPWCPGYLEAVADRPALSAWARLLSTALATERRNLGELSPTGRLPVALRTAPPPLGPTDATEGLLDALVAPLRSGVLLTRSDLWPAARSIGAGLRQGERRFALGNLLEQDPVGLLDWLGRFATGWAARHEARAAATVDPVAGWWAARAGQTARWCAERSGQQPPAVR